MANELEDEVYFDGGESNAKKSSYVEKCKGRAINLNIKMTGHYDRCWSCEYQMKCIYSAEAAGEQSDL